MRKAKCGAPARGKKRVGVASTSQTRETRAVRSSESFVRPAGNSVSRPQPWPDPDFFREILEESLRGLEADRFTFAQRTKGWPPCLAAELQKLRDAMVEVRKSVLRLHHMLWGETDEAPSRAEAHAVRPLRLVRGSGEPYGKRKEEPLAED
jgi:hypothetical protein